MGKKIALGLVAAAIVGALLWPAAAFAQGQKVVVLYGDSQFSSKTSVATRLASLRKGDSVVTVANGWTSAHAKKLIKREVLRPYSPNVVVLNFGLNDASKDASGKNRRTISEYVKNMKSAIRKAQKTGAQVIVVTPIPVDYSKRAALWSDKDISRYASALIELASSMGATVVDAYGIFKASPNYLAYLSDGIHFNEAGSELIAKNINAAIK